MQVAVSILLLVSGGLFIRSVQHGRAMDLGFDPRNVVTTSMDIRGSASSADATAVFWIRLIDEIRRMPLTESASLSARLPLELGVVVLSTTGGAVGLGVISLMSLVLTSLGLFGAVAQTAGSRTYEIGVRRALGAPDRHVIWLVVRDAFLLVGAGLFAGIVMAVAASRALRSLLYDVDPADAVVLGTAPIILLAVAALAAWLPACRAARINAAAALRYE